MNLIAVEVGWPSLTVPHGIVGVVVTLSDDIFTTVHGFLTLLFSGIARIPHFLLISLKLFSTCCTISMNVMSFSLTVLHRTKDSLLVYKTTRHIHSGPFIASGESFKTGVKNSISFFAHQQ